MARKFAGSVQSLTSSANVNLSSSNKFTLAFWLWWDTFANDDALAFEHSANYNSNLDAFLVDPNSTAGGLNKFQFAYHGTVGYSDYCFTRPSTGAWHHYVGLYDISLTANEVTAYLDGAVPSGAQRSINANNSADTCGSYILNFMSRNNGTLPGNGRLAEVALWKGVILNTDEITALAKGFAPSLIRPASLAYYWPLLTGNSPETELIQANTATVTGATTTDHPAIIYPAPPLILATPAAVAGGKLFRQADLAGLGAGGPFFGDPLRGF